MRYLDRLYSVTQLLSVPFSLSPSSNGAVASVLLSAKYAFQAYAFRPISVHFRLLFVGFAFSYSLDLLFRFCRFSIFLILL